MKQFYYIDENNGEQIDLIRLFEHCFDHVNITDDDIILAIKQLEKHVNISAKNDIDDSGFFI